MRNHVDGEDACGRARPLRDEVPSNKGLHPTVRGASLRSTPRPAGEAQAMRHHFSKGSLSDVSLQGYPYFQRLAAPRGSHVR